ncbi:unnamed protein product, partial [Didymodactylos carnosus]
MASNKRLNSNQTKQWHMYAKNFEDESDDKDDDVDDEDSDDPEILDAVKNSSDESEDDTDVEKGSGDESDPGYLETDSISDDEPPKRRVKRGKTIEEEKSTAKIFTARSGRQWS